MMIETIKKMNCHSFLLINTNTPYTKGDTTQLRVRWQIKRNLKNLGFLPFAYGWSIKPLDTKKAEDETREKLKSFSYDLPVTLFLFAVPGESIKNIEQYVNKLNSQ